LNRIEQSRTKYAILFCSVRIYTVGHKQESRAVAGNPRDAAVIFDP